MTGTVATPSPTLAETASDIHEFGPEEIDLRRDDVLLLCQRLLRECGFVEVEVTGRSGDGGIDGSGILRLQRLVTVNVLFQSKRYNASNPVGSAQIRDFRGAMQGRTDKGLLITTGRFTADAVKEATRDGAPTIDLIDGDQLVDLLKDLKLGVETELVERVTVKREWFEQI